jgi:hypothetical protein
LEVTQIYDENLRVILEADKEFCDAGVGNHKECNAAHSIMEKIGLTPQMQRL